MNSQIIHLYNTGMNASAIGRLLGLSKVTILYHLRRAGVAIRSSVEVTRKLSDAGEQSLVDRYINGESINKLHKSFKISLRAVSYILRKHCVKTRGLHESVGCKPVTLPKPNTFFFDYWLGLMLTDGWVYTRKYSNVFGFGSQDLELVELLRDRISVGRTIYTTDSFYRLLLPVSATDVQAMAKWGLTHRKSLTLTPTVFLKSLKQRHFNQLLVGLIEGDGSVFYTSKKRVPTIYYYSGSFKFCQHIIDRVGYGTIIRNRAIYRCTWTCSQAIELAYELLKCKHLTLDRKWGTAKSFY